MRTLRAKRFLTCETSAPGLAGGNWARGGEPSLRKLHSTLANPARRGAPDCRSPVFAGRRLQDRSTTCCCASGKLVKSVAIEWDERANPVANRNRQTYIFADDAKRSRHFRGFYWCIAPANVGD